MKLFMAVFIGLSANNLISAERQWIRSIQLNIGNDWKMKFARLGPGLNNEELNIVCIRINHWQRNDWNKHEYLLLICRHHFTRLCIQSLPNYIGHSDSLINRSICSLVIVLPIEE